MPQVWFLSWPGVSIDGSVPQQLTGEPSGQPIISADGKTITKRYVDKTSGQRKIALIPIEGGAPARVFDLDPSEPRSYIRWTPDALSIAFVRTTNAVSNIWAQPLPGGEPKQLTVSKDLRIFNFAWSRDGKQLAVSRGVSNTDAVLITGFKWLLKVLLLFPERLLRPFQAVRVSVTFRDKRVTLRANSPFRF